MKNFKRIVLLVVLLMMVFFVIAHSWLVVNLGVVLGFLGLVGLLVYIIV